MEVNLSKKEVKWNGDGVVHCAADVDRGLDDRAVHYCCCEFPMWIPEWLCISQGSREKGGAVSLKTDELAANLEKGDEPDLGRPKRNDEQGSGTVGSELGDDIGQESEWRVDPVAGETPVLTKGVHGLCAGAVVAGVETGELRVEVGGEAIHLGLVPQSAAETLTSARV